MIEVILLILFLAIFDQLLLAAGSWPMFISTLLCNHNKFGKVFTLLLVRTQIQVLFKLFSWFSSGVGLLVGYHIHMSIYGKSDRGIEYIIILVFSIFILLRLLGYMISLQTFSFQKMVDKARRVNPLRNPLNKNLSDPKNSKRLSLNFFIDTNIPLLFRLVACFALIILSCTELGFFKLESGGSLDLIDALKIPLSTINLTKSIITLTGNIWIIFKLFMAFIFFFWAAMFISLSSTLVDVIDLKPDEQTNS